MAAAESAAAICSIHKFEFPYWNEWAPVFPQEEVFYNLRKSR